MVEIAVRRMTLDEFLVWDDGTDRRYELIDGVPVAMAPPLADHGDLIGAIAAAIRPRLRRPCRLIVEAGIVPANRGHSYYQADSAVTCRSREGGERYLIEPKVIFEVLSPSTEKEVREIKLPDYRMIPSVSEIVLVHMAERRVELWSRLEGQWHMQELAGDAPMPLPSLSITLDLAAIYDGIVD